MGDPQRVGASENHISNAEDGMSPIITQLITGVVALLTGKEDHLDSSAWARETADFVSRVITIGIGPLANDWTSGWLSMLFGTTWFSFAFLTIPIILTGIIWYIILTFFLKKNVAGILLGRSLSFATEILDSKNQDYLDYLSTRVSGALDQHR